MTLLRQEADKLLTLDRAEGDESPFWLPLAPSFPGAKCRDEYPELWFPHDGDIHAGIALKVEAMAVDTCYDCPHMLDCGAYAVKNRVQYGVWGGYTEKERHELFREAA